MVPYIAQLNTYLPLLLNIGRCQDISRCHCAPWRKLHGGLTTPAVAVETSEMVRFKAAFGSQRSPLATTSPTTKIQQLFLSRREFPILVPRWWLAPPPVARRLATWGTSTTSIHNNLSLDLLFCFVEVFGVEIFDSPNAPVEVKR
jgi:hypothetical protein